MWRRNHLINVLIEKDESDRALWATANQRHEWYTIRLEELPSAEMRATFHQAQYDQESEQFLNRSLALSNNICLQLYYSFMVTLLSVALTKTSVNGLLGRGGMFIFSRAHLHSFLSIPDDWSPRDKRLIDIGAGDGQVTVVLKQFFNQITAVEASKVMEWRLSQRGFKLLPTDKWPHSGPYDLICALNLLDRHYDPAQLLTNLHHLALESGGCPVLLSLVLPLNQFVEFGPNNGGKNTPKKRLFPFGCCSGNSFEAQASALATEVFQPAGFRVLRWTKLPYLCEGDMARAYYKLDDAVFLLQAVPKPTTADNLDSAKKEEEITNTIALPEEPLLTIHDEI